MKHFLHRKLLQAGFGVKKSVFLHQKSLWTEFGAKMRHFLHRKAGWQAVRCQKECFSAPKITYSRKWCQNGHIPAPKPPVSKKQKNQLFSWFFVRAKGLEPPRRKTLDPKSSAATNYATPAFRIGTAKVGIFSQNANFLYLWRNPGNNVWKYSN